jgi:cellobiose phosphorylase
MYRLGLEAILGVQRQGQWLRLAPCLPHDWPQVSLTYRHGTTTYHICINNPQGVSSGVETITLDGAALSDGLLPLQDDGEHHQVQVYLGKSHTKA